MCQAMCAPSWLLPHTIALHNTLLHYILLLTLHIRMVHFIAVVVGGGGGGFLFGHNELTVSQPIGLVVVEQRRVRGGQVKELAVVNAIPGGEWVTD